MTLEQLNKMVRDTIAALTPAVLPIVHYPNAPRPDGVYASVNLLSLTPVGQGEIQYAPDGEDVKTGIYPEFFGTVSVNFYREGARQYAGEFVIGLSRPSVVAEWNANGVGLVRSSNVRDLTSLPDVDFEERAQVDVDVHFLLTPVEETLPGINVFRIRGTIDNGARVVETVEIDLMPYN